MWIEFYFAPSGQTCSKGRSTGMPRCYRMRDCARQAARKRLRLENKWDSPVCVGPEKEEAAVAACKHENAPGFHPGLMAMDTNFGIVARMEGHSASRYGPQSGTRAAKNHAPALRQKRQGVLAPCGLRSLRRHFNIERRLARLRSGGSRRQGRPARSGARRQYCWYSGS